MAQLVELPIKALILEYMDLTTRELSRICDGLRFNSVCEELSIRHNKIDILGVRYLEGLGRKGRVKVDARNN